MASTTYSRSLNALLTTTADKIHASGAVTNAVSNSNVMFKELMDGGKIKKNYDGGDQILVNLMYEETMPESFAGYEQINVAPNDGITACYLPLAQYGRGLSISGIEELKNAGNAKIADLVKEKVKQLTAGWATKFQQDLWEVDNLQATTHPYTANSGKNMIGIPLYVQALSASTLAMDYNIGHIDQSAETWWQNKVFDAGDSQTEASFKKLLSHAYNTLSNGSGGEPNLIVMDQVSYELYEQSMQDQVRYQFKDKASAGFESLAFKNAKVVWDGYVPDMETSGTNNGAFRTGSALTKGSIFMLNTNTLSLYIAKGRDFKPRGFQTPVDQDASTSLYLAALQLVCNDRRKNGVIFDMPLTLS